MPFPPRPKDKIKDKNIFEQAVYLRHIIITMPGYILKKYPAAQRQLFWEPTQYAYANTSHRRYSFLQLGWSGGQKRKTGRCVSNISLISSL